MASILDQYGIKEVADVTLYEIFDDGTESPVLFLDTLKISTIEQTAEQAEARGGKGNPPLIIWDYGKEITVTLQDALYSPASMAVMFGDKDGASTETSMTITKMEKVVLTATPTELPTDGVWYTINTAARTSNDTDYHSMVSITTTTELANFEKGDVLYKEKTYKSVEGSVIEINHDTFPGTYKLVGDTLARDRRTGKDKYFQFVIPKAKMSSENTITLEAEGDPSVFDMTMRVLRPDDGAMMKLIQYDLDGKTPGTPDGRSTFAARKASLS